MEHRSGVPRLVQLEGASIGQPNDETRIDFLCRAIKVIDGVTCKVLDQWWPGYIRLGREDEVLSLPKRNLTLQEELNYCVQE